MATGFFFSVLVLAQNLIHISSSVVVLRISRKDKIYSGLLFYQFLELIHSKASYVFGKCIG